MATRGCSLDEFLQSVLLFLLAPGDPESGAVYVLDRKTGTWYSVDFDDKQYGGYSVSHLEEPLKDFRFLDLVERPGAFGKRVSIDGGKAASGRRPAFHGNNLPGYQPTPTSLRTGAAVWSFSIEEGGRLHG